MTRAARPAAARARRHPGRPARGPSFRAPPRSSSRPRPPRGRPRRASSPRGSATRTCTKTSPGGPPSWPGVPLAAEADPLAVVDARRHVDVELVVDDGPTRAVALRARRLDDRPRPSHWRQVALRTNCPNRFCDTCCTRPAPSQVGHVTGLVPGAAPFPSHASQARATRIGHADGRPGEGLGERDLDQWR